MTSIDRPRIAVDLRALVGRPSGIGYLTLSLLEALGSSARARYVGMAQRPVAEEQRLRQAGVALEAHGAPLGLWWQQWQLPRRLAVGDIDLLWSPLLTLPLRLPVPGVVTVHDLTPLLFPETHRLKVRLSVLPFLRPTLERARRIAVDSEATAADLRTHFPSCAERLRVVYPGIDAAFRPAPKEQVEATRKAVGCPDGYLLFAGTLEPRKNVAMLLDAWEGLRSAESGTPPLLIVGPYGWRSRRLLGRMRRLSSRGLHYLGHVARERLVELVQAARVFVYPSLYEGFGLPPAEAMACGVPTIVSNRSSLPEVVGDAGLLVDPDDAADLARGLSSLFDSPGLAQRLGERGVERSRRFSWERSAELMDQLFDEALE